MQCVINTLHTPKEGKENEKSIYNYNFMYDFANFTVTVYANDSNVNIVSADNYESREFNQWNSLSIIFHLMLIHTVKEN